MHPYSMDTVIPQADRMVPTSHSNSVKPILPADFTIDPGVANIPLPMTRDTTRIYALDQVSVFPWEDTPGEVFGKPECSSSGGKLSVGSCNAS
jgi:hypothetical protein